MWAWKTLSSHVSTIYIETSTKSVVLFVVASVYSVVTFYKQRDVSLVTRVVNGRSLLLLRLSYVINQKREFLWRLQLYLRNIYT